MDDEGIGPSPEAGQEWWRRAFHHPEVERVDIARTVVRVRLRSGIELEWPRDSGARAS